MKTIFLNEFMKIEIVEVSEETVEVTFYELMGERWVRFGNSERWDKESCYKYYNM